MGSGKAETAEVGCRDVRGGRWEVGEVGSEYAETAEVGGGSGRPEMAERCGSGSVKWEVGSPRWPR